LTGVFYLICIPAASLWVWRVNKTETAKHELTQHESFNEEGTQEGLMQDKHPIGEIEMKAVRWPGEQIRGGSNQAQSSSIMQEGLDPNWTF